MAFTAILHVTLLRLTGPGFLPLTPAYSGRVVQFGGLAGSPVRVRIVEFKDDNASVREIGCLWSQLEPLVRLLDELCGRQADVRDVLDTPPSWEQITLEANLNGRQCSVHLTMGASGFEGTDAPLLRSFLTEVEGLCQTYLP